MINVILKVGKYSFPATLYRHEGELVWRITRSHLGPFPDYPTLRLSYSRKIQTYIAPIAPDYTNRSFNYFPYVEGDVERIGAVPWWNGLFVFLGLYYD